MPRRFLLPLLFVTSLGFAGEPAQPEEFRRAGIVEAWETYGGVLTFGRGQTLALVDDGCKLAMPEWTAQIDGVPKVLVTHDAVDGDSDPAHGKRGYHGSTIGIPSSVNYGGKWGVAYNNQVAVIRGVECCHCKIAESGTLAAALQWIIENHQQHRITTVNVAPVDDQAHAEPVPTEIDAKLAELRRLGIWVSAPAGNHNFTNGISWPASQPNCFAIGAVKLGKAEVYLDRHAKIDLVVPARATSSSNAILCGAAMLLREAIEKGGYDWRSDGANLPEAMMAIFQKTGQPVEDPGTQRTFRRLNVLAALQHVLPAPVSAPSAAAAAAKPSESGAVQLFNGRDLEGWEGDPQYWSVQDGALTGVTDGSLKMNRFITWKGAKARNFDLRVKVKVTPGGNSGLQYRGKMAPELGSDIVTGYQCDVVADNPNYNGMLYEEKGRRILSHTGERVIVAPDGQPWIIGKMPVKQFAAGEWHEYRVLARANHHQHWIDDHMTADLIDLDEKGRALEGVFAVQVHVGPAMKIQYQDFRFQPLPDDLPLLRAEDHPIPAGSLGVKPQGKLPKDWQPPVYPGK